MSSLAPGWYVDPADRSTQRWWDGEGWLGDPIPASAVPPVGPPAKAAPAAPARAQEKTAVAPAPVAARPAPGPAAVAGYATPAQGQLHYMEIHPRPHGLMLASPGSRFMARIVDATVVLVLAAIANAWFAVEFWRALQPLITWAAASTDPWNPSGPVPASATRVNEMLVAMTLVLAAVWFAYEVPATSNSGQTLGKRLFGIRVVGLGPEESLGFGQSWRRWFRLGWPTAFWALCFGITALFQILDCLFIVIDRRMHLALHDRVALTAVVQVPRAGRPETQRTAPPAGGPDADPR